MYTSAFLGCGRRARAIARAYRFVRGGKPAAACDRHLDRVRDFGRDLGIGGVYTDLQEMLEKEKPDLLHIVTQPTERVDPMRAAAEHGVPVVLVEKPICVQGEDWKQLARLPGSSATRFLVNTQLHFHARNLELKRDVAEGRIGEVRFVDVSAGSTILDQGVHVLELAHSYNGYSAPTRVLAALSGAETLSTRQPSPDVATAAVEFANGVRAQMVTGSFAPRTNPSEVIFRHKRIAVYGTRGFVHWTMAGWERSTADGGYESGEHDYQSEDDLAQAALTDSAFDLIDNPDREHGTRLELALVQFNIILGAYMSALRREPVDLPCEPEEGLLASLEALLAGPSHGV